MADVIEATVLAQTRSHGSTQSANNATLDYLPLEIEQSHKKRSTGRLIGVSVGLHLSLFIAALDQTIIATAIPTISASLKSSSGFVWIGGAYLVASAGTGPIWTKLSDIFGRKAILLTVIVWFAASSVVCAAAHSMTTLIVGRAFQGVAGGALSQLVVICLSDIFSMRRRTLMFALVELVWCVAGGTGPLLGGALAQFVSWRWAFYLNLPVCCVSFVLVLVLLDVHNPRTRVVDGLKAIDWAGSMSLLAFTLMILVGLNFGGVVYSWSNPHVYVLLIVGSLMSLFFVYAEKKLTKYPLMPPHIFKDTSNIAALALVFFHGLVFLGIEFYLPLYFQSVKLAGPFRSGILILPLVVAEGIGGILCGIYTHQSGSYRKPMYAGVFIMMIGISLYTTLTPKLSIANIIGYEVLGGFGAGLLFSPPLLSIQARVAQKDVAVSTATFGFSRNLACAISIILGGTVFSNEMIKQKGSLIAANLDLAIVDLFASKDAAANVLQIERINNTAQRLAVQNSYSNSLRYTFILYVAFSAAAFVASLFIKSAVLSSEHTETKTGLIDHGETINNN